MYINHNIYLTSLILNSTIFLIYPELPHSPHALVLCFSFILRNASIEKPWTVWIFKGSVCLLTGNIPFQIRQTHLKSLIQSSQIFFKCQRSFPRKFIRNFTVSIPMLFCTLILSILFSILYHLLLTYMSRINITFFLSVYHFVYPQINKDFCNICNHLYDKIKHLTLLHILVIRFPNLPERRGCLPCLVRLWLIGDIRLLDSISCS